MMMMIYSTPSSPSLATNAFTDQAEIALALSTLEFVHLAVLSAAAGQWTAKCFPSGNKDSHWRPDCK